ncbi:MAG: prepilin peptidase [Candidatus Thorarchaeota archaeon]
MTLDLSLTSLVAFATTLTILIFFAILDIRDRRIANHFVLIGGAGGFVITILTDHLSQNPILHLTAFPFVTVLSYATFRIGAIGGADLKALVILSITSPGIELALWVDPVLEAIVGGGLMMLFMLIAGYVYSNRSIRSSESGTPLIPFLSVAYVLIQLLALL